MNSSAFDALSSVVSEPLLLLDRDGTIVASSRQAAELFGQSVKEISGVSLGVLFEGASEELARYVQQSARTASSVPGAFRYSRHDGGETMFRTDTARVSAAGEPVRLLMRLRTHSKSVRQFSELRSRIDELAGEIHNRRRAERLLDSQKKALEQILSGSPLADTFDALLRSIEDVAPSGMAASILLLDHEAGQLRHLSAPSLPDAYNDAIDGLEIGPAAGSCGTAAFLNEQVVVTDIETDPLWAPWKDLALSHDLRACWSTPIPSRTGTVLGTFAMYFNKQRAPAPADRELSELVSRTAAIAIESRLADERTQEALKRETAARARAEEADRLKGEFLATVSHELRTPLTSILGWTRLLQDDPSEAELEEGLSTIESSARAQTTLVDDLLDVSRLSIGRMKLQMGPVDLISLIRSAVATVRPLAIGRHLKLDIRTPDEIAPVLGDAQRLHQILWNLLTNAIKFSPVNGTIRLELEQLEESARVTVTDEGHGVDPDFLPRMFTRFSQAEPSLTRAQGGLGLGLSIVNDLVQLHGGLIDVQSEPGKGARFRIEIPLARDSGEIEVRIHRQHLDGAELAEIDLLLVEDDPGTREFLITLLERAGARIAVADTFETALIEYRRRHPAVILCDLGLPGATGIDLIRAIAKEPAGIPGVAIAMSAYLRETQGADALAEGFHTFLSKPIEPEMLIAEIQARLKGDIRLAAGRDALPPVS